MNKRQRKKREKADQQLASHVLRMKFAYLAGLIKGDERTKLKAMYEREHVKHTTKRHSWCALCEMAQIEATWDRPSLFASLGLQDVRREPFKGADYSQPVKLGWR